MNGGHGKGHPALTEQDLDAIADAHLGGASLRSLAAQYGVSGPALSYRMRERGVTKPRPAPEPIPVSAGWMERGLCVTGDYDPEVWFPEDAAGIKYAKRICRDCPVIEDCKRAATRRGEKAGVFGGHYFGATHGNPATLAVREWAAANGYELPATGRLPSAVIAAYREARAA